MLVMTIFGPWALSLIMQKFSGLLLTNVVPPLLWGLYILRL